MWSPQELPFLAEKAARREIATNLRDAREVISVKDITAVPLPGFNSPGAHQAHPRTHPHNRVYLAQDYATLYS